jgi:multicomponent Na+:H+ antiporter subunit E
MKFSIRKVYIIGIILAIAWFVLLGPESIFMTCFGIISIVLSLFISVKMRYIKQQDEVNPKSILEIIKYCLWIIREVYIAGLDVTKRVWSATGSSKSGFCELSLLPTSDSGLVIFANSITLTPGTITVAIDQFNAVIHTLDTSLRDGLIENNNNIMKKINTMIKYD